MKIKDIKNINNINNKNLNEFDGLAVHENSVSHYERQKGGIVKIERTTAMADDEFQTMQEQHNANHALYYLSIISDALIAGRQTGNDCEKIRRIIEHMLNLREFIPDRKSDLREAIQQILADIRKICPVQKRQLGHFILKNWNSIRTFAEAYGHHEQCFSDRKYQKLHDVCHGKCYFKIWWLQMKAQKMLARLKHKLKKGMK